MKNRKRVWRLHLDNRVFYLMAKFEEISKRNNQAARILIEDFKARKGEDPSSKTWHFCDAENIVRDFCFETAQAANVFIEQYISFALPIRKNESCYVLMNKEIAKKFQGIYSEKENVHVSLVISSSFGEKSEDDLKKEKRQRSLFAHIKWSNCPMKLISDRDHQDIFDQSGISKSYVHLSNDNKKVHEHLIAIAKVEKFSVFSKSIKRILVDGEEFSKEQFEETQLDLNSLAISSRSPENVINGLTNPLLQFVSYENDVYAVIGKFAISSDLEEKMLLEERDLVNIPEKQQDISQLPGVFDHARLLGEAENMQEKITNYFSEMKKLYRL